MNGFTLLGKELQRIAKDKKLLIPIIAILMVPLIYAGMFLWSFLDPYAKMDELPVAVVNSDEGATLEGVKLQLGESLVRNLKDSDAFDFHIVSEKDAMQGLDDQTYYMVIKIPNDFSNNATTLLDSNPRKLQLQYISNDSYNFLASQIGETAVSKIQTTMSQEVSKTYAETLFSKVTEMKDGFQAASDGSEQLDAGAIDLRDGAEELKDNLEVLASKSIEFQDGIQTAQSGIVALHDGTGELASGLGQLTDAGGQLLNGSQDLHTGTNSLVSGISDAQDGTDTLNQNMPLLIDGTQEVQAGLKEFQNQLPKQLAENFSNQLAGTSGDMHAGINQLHASIDSGLTDKLAPQLTEGLAQNTASEIAKSMAESQQKQISDLDKLLSSYGVENKDAILAALTKDAPSEETLQQNLYQSLQPRFEAGINKGIAQSVSEIDAGFGLYQDELAKQLTASNMEKQIADAVNPVFNKLSSGLTSVQQGQKEVQYGVSQLNTGMNQLYAGAQKLGNGEDTFASNMDLFTKKLGEAEVGAWKLHDGTYELASGMSQLADGASQFTDGSAKLADGSVQLSEGTNELQKGTDELHAKLGDAADQISSINPDQDTYEMMASPVELDIHHANKVPNYGTGFAPYFISLGLFVGALLLTIIFPLNDTAGIPNNGLSWFLSKFGVMAFVGIIQAVLTDMIVLYGLDIEVQSVPLFILFTIVTSLTFITLIQFLVTLGNNPGRFVAIIILILQLTSSAGTFPLEVIPKAVQWFNPLLPMTYSVQGFKAVISNGDYGFMWHNVGILFAYIAGSVIITTSYFIWKHKKQFKNETNMNEQVA
jgi:putative membrane protein